MVKSRHEFLEGRQDCCHCGAEGERLTEPCYGRLSSTMQRVGEFHVVFGLSRAEEQNVPVCHDIDKVVLLTHAGLILKIASALKLYLADQADARMRGQNMLLLERAQVMIEELGEVLEAMVDGDPAHLLHELVDLHWVTEGTVLGLGLQDYFDAAHREVARANMSKLGPDGKPIIDASGRVVKPEGFKKADVTSVLRRYNHE